ncbi:unnamed protein product [Ectocarpus sp. 12 AP-2014]
MLAGSPRCAQAYVGVDTYHEYCHNLNDFQKRQPVVRKCRLLFKVWCPSLLGDVLFYNK